MNKNTLYDDLSKLPIQNMGNIMADHCDSSSPTTEEIGLTDCNGVKELPMIAESPPALRELLRDGREKRGLKQKDVAERIGVTPTIINRLEAGATIKPSQKVLKKIAPYAGVGYSKLLYICGYPNDMEREIFYRMDGEGIIDYTKIAGEIYYLNASLLETMDGIDKISYENAIILEKLIKTMKLTAEIEKDSKIEKKQRDIWTRIFKSTMMFLLEQLTTLNDILCAITT